MRIKFIKPQHRKESSCTCGTCKAMCLQSPCYPTPEDVERLIAAGYKDQLMISIFVDATTGEFYPSVAPIQTSRSACKFLNGKLLCELHKAGLKPLEGKLASHDAVDNGLRVWVCKKWYNDKGLEVFKKFNPDPLDIELFLHHLTANKNEAHSLTSNNF